MISRLYDMACVAVVKHYDLTKLSSTVNGQILVDLYKGGVRLGLVNELWEHFSRLELFCDALDLCQNSTILFEFVLLAEKQRRYFGELLVRTVCRYAALMTHQILEATSRCERCLVADTENDILLFPKDLPGLHQTPSPICECSSATAGGSCLCSLSLSGSCTSISALAGSCSRPLSPDIAVEPECCHNSEKYKLVCQQLIVLLNRGYKVVEFFVESGQIDQARNVITALLQIPLTRNRTDADCVISLLNIRLLQIHTVDCKFFEGYQIFIRTRARLKSSLYGRHLLALLYGEEASRMMALCKHKSAITWVQRAIKHIKPELPAALTIEVFRQCCKICVASKLFAEARALMVYSLKLSEETHGSSHPCHAQTLLIYGFYLLNMSDIDESVQVYRQCLDIFLNTLGDVNLKTACARQALGLALFIQGYNQYNFPEALWQIEKSTQILENLLNSKHVFIAASWRLKALLLEGLAANTDNEQVAITNLRQAKKLYWSCVKMSREIVGEMTVQTARYYEHVGKVYRVLGKPHKAEDCLLRAEFIMNHVLEEGSHESLGVTVHIATLYAFDLDKKTYAERLFLRCLRSLREIRGVGVDDFIEMCYRGLLRVSDNRPDQQNLYLQWYNEWRDHLQEQNEQSSEESTVLFNSLGNLLEYVSRELKTSTRNRSNSNNVR